MRCARELHYYVLPKNLTWNHDLILQHPTIAEALTVLIVINESSMKTMKMENVFRLPTPIPNNREGGGEGLDIVIIIINRGGRGVGWG